MGARVRPRRTPTTEVVLSLPDGNEDNDLWVRVGRDGGDWTITSVWEIEPADRAAILAGANIELIVFGRGHPPVDMRVTDEQLGKGTA